MSNSFKISTERQRLILSTLIEIPDVYRIVITSGRETTACAYNILCLMDAGRREAIKKDRTTQIFNLRDNPPQPMLLIKQDDRSGRITYSFNTVRQNTFVINSEDVLINFIRAMMVFLLSLDNDTYSGIMGTPRSKNVDEDGLGVNDVYIGIYRICVAIGYKVAYRVEDRGKDRDSAYVYTFMDTLGKDRILKGVTDLILELVQVGLNEGETSIITHFRTLKTNEEPVSVAAAAAVAASSSASSGMSHRNNIPAGAGGPGGSSPAPAAVAVSSSGMPPSIPAGAGGPSGNSSAAPGTEHNTNAVLEGGRRHKKTHKKRHTKRKTHHRKRR